MRWHGTWVAVLLALAACSRPGDAEKAPLSIAVVEEALLREAVAAATGLGLTTRDAEGRVAPGLARSWRVSNDGSFIIFRLRPVTDRQGRTVEARDVVRALEAARGPAGDPVVRDLLQGLRDVRAPLPEVVEVRLSTPQPEMLEVLALPELAVRAGPGRRLPDVPGPMRLAERTQAAVVHLEPDPEFYQAGSGLRPVTLKRLDAPEAVRAFRSGEADLVLGTLLDGVSEARLVPRRDSLVLSIARAVIRVAINQGDPALADLRVRRALDQAVDRERLGRLLYGSPDAVALDRLTPPDLSGYPAIERPLARLPLEERREAARRQLAAAGFPAGKLALSLAIPDSNEARRLAERLAEDWAAVGVRVQVLRRPPARHRALFAEGRFQLALETVASPIDSPLPFLVGLACGRNRHESCLPEADRLVRDSWNTLTLAERMAALAAAERLWLEDAAAIPLVQPLRWALVAPGVEGFRGNRAGVHPLAALERRG
ncbi:ABC transporter substrate-binding protein [Thermaurantiacus sp.]